MSETRDEQYADQGSEEQEHLDKKCNQLVGSHMMMRKQIALKATELYCGGGSSGAIRAAFVAGFGKGAAK